MANRTDKFPPGLCGTPENLPMKRKKLAVHRICGAPAVKMATGGSPFAPSRIPPVNQPKD
jgi:hypothetical protein